MSDLVATTFNMVDENPLVQYEIAFPRKPLLQAPSAVVT